jgi:hypothetical protein
MNNIKPQEARQYAEFFVNERYKPLEAANFFNFYFVIVGEDVNRAPNSIYADNLPINELSLVNSSKAARVFVEKCDYQNEYLVQVKIDRKNKKVDSKILMSPSNK